jgi:hemolysin activation/secretion protein
MDLLGARILEIQWGGRLRGDASHKRYILDDLTTQDLRRLAKRITRRRRAHGYVMQNAGRR